MTDFEKYSLAVQIIASSVLIVGMVIAIAQLHLINKGRKAEHEWNRRSKALFYSFSDDPEIMSVLFRLDKYLKINSTGGGEISLAAIDELEKKEYKKIRYDIHFALARLDNMCIALKHSAADEKICRDLLENRTVSFYRFFRQYIEDIRKRRGSDSILKNMEQFAVLWSGELHPEIRSRSDK